MMTYYDFLMRLEQIALENDLRLVMSRAPFGCGFLFGFTNKYGEYSEPVSLLLNHTEPDELFAELEKEAKKFKEKIV